MMTPEDTSLFKAHFQHYNFNLYAIELYEKWINAKKYQNCSSENLKKILQDYHAKLLHKAQIDIIFDRKTELAKNKKALLKIEELNPELSSHLNHPTEDSLAITKVLQAEISYVNSHRLDLVWSRNLIDTLVGLSVNGNANISAISSQIALLNGVASYGFYFVRGGMDLAKLVKHSFLTQNQLLTDHNIKLADKLRLQWGLRYASIINDIILWGPVNFVTFHFLYGMGTLGYFGNVLTAGLLFCDFGLNLFNYLHTQKKFKALEQTLRDQEVDQKIIAELEAEHLKVLKHLKWYVYYSAGLCLGFVTLCTFMIPGPELSAFYLPGTLLLGSFAILGLQILLNLKDMITKLQEAGDSQELKHIAMVEGLARIFMQSLMPSSILLGSLILPVSGLPVWFVTGAALVVSSLIIKITNDLVKNYVLNEEILKLTKDNAKLSTQEDSTKDYTENNNLIFVKRQELATNHDKTLKDCIYASSVLSGITALGMGLSLATTSLAPLMVIPLLIMLFTLALPKFMDHQPRVNSLVPA